MSVARPGRPYQTWWVPPPIAEIICSLGAWAGAGKHSDWYNFRYMAASDSVFDSRGGFFHYNLSDKDIVTVGTAPLGWLSSWALTHILVV